MSTQRLLCGRDPISSTQTSFHTIHFPFEDRWLADFESRSAALLASYAHFPIANRSWVDFQLGHQQYFAHGVPVPFENQPVIDCQIGNTQFMHHGVFSQKVIILRFIMSFGERNWHGILPAKDMSGYGPAGRGATFPDWLPDWLSDWLSEKNFCTTHLSKEMRSLVEFT